MLADIQRFARRRLAEAGAPGGSPATSSTSSPRWSTPSCRRRWPASSTRARTSPPPCASSGPSSPRRGSSFEQPGWWDELDSGRPVVHVTQGTLDNADLGRLLLRDDPRPGPRRPARRGHHRRARPRAVAAGPAGERPPGALRPPRPAAPPRRRHGHQWGLRRRAAGAGQRRPPGRGRRQRGQARGRRPRAVVRRGHQPAHRPALARHGGGAPCAGCWPATPTARGRGHSRPRSPPPIPWPPSAPHWPTLCDGQRRGRAPETSDPGPPGQGSAERGRLQSAACRPSPRSGRVRWQRARTGPALPDSFPESGLLEDLPARELHRGLFHLLFGREPAPRRPLRGRARARHQEPRASSWSG